MKLKKKVKRFIFAVIIIALLVAGGYFYYKNQGTTKDVKETKVVNEIKKYGYKLKDNKTKRYKKMFKELKEILEAKEVDEEKYLNKITEMFIYDFYSLEDKAAKTDVGGVDFVYEPFLPNFLENAQDTYYKYIETNIYNNRKQALPVVDKITIESSEKKEFAYGDKNDPEAYTVKVKWTYTDEDNFAEYQDEATIVFIHDDIKLSLVELQ